MKQHLKLKMKKRVVANLAKPKALSLVFEVNEMQKYLDRIRKVKAEGMEIRVTPTGKRGRITVLPAIPC